jgi:hypothetical protein
MNTKKVLGFTGFGLAILGGCFWMIGQISLSLIVWGLTFLIIVKLKRLNKAKINSDKRKK